MIHKRNLKYPSIIQYTIYGERHSGTNFLQQILSQYLDIPLTWDYGWKHWFGFTDQKKIIRSPRTLFVCIVRNPYNWINAFFANPHHVPLINQQSIENFVFNGWFSIDPSKAGAEILEDRNYLNNQRYANLIQLRKYKLFYLRHILFNIADNCVIIRYEDLIANPQRILSDISTIYSIPNTQDQNFFVENKYNYGMCPHLLEKINNQIDWQVENHIGYSKSNSLG